MENQLNSQLFSAVSTETASQTNGGHCYHSYSYSRPVRIVYRYPVYTSPSYGYGYGSGSGSGSTSNINVTRPRIKGGSIVTF